MTDRTIRIRQPLPLDVAGNIVSALGAMYPDARIVLDHLGRDLVIDLGTRTARHSKKRMADQMDEDTDSPQAEFTRDGMTTYTPQEATLALAEWAHAILTAHPDAVNYVEQQATLPARDGQEERSFLITACWSKGQTPHALRMAAEVRAEKAEARIRELEAS